MSQFHQKDIDEEMPLYIYEVLNSSDYYRMSFY